MIKHRKRITVIGCFLFLAYLFLGCVLPFLHRKRISNALKDSFHPESCYANAQGSERVLCIDDNTEALLWRIRVIETAQHEIILSTFSFDHDNSGQDIMSALLHAAERGVHIRILIDAFNGALKLTGSRHFKALISHPNIHVKFYNPINPIKPWKINPRMHDKYLVADDSVYILGGRNTNDLFLGDYAGKKNTDRDLLVYETIPGQKETSLFQLQRYFERIWKLPCNKDRHYTRNNKRVTEAQAGLISRYHTMRMRYPEAFEPVDYSSATIATNKITLLTNPQEPTNKEPRLWYMLHQMMMKGKDVVVQTPYIICSRDMYKDLTALCDSTGSVEIITNAVESGANPWGCVDYLTHKKKILRTGTEIYEFLGQRSNHAKAMLIDDRISIVGSFNLDMRSAYLDTEMMLAVDCEPLNKSLRISTNINKVQSKRVSPDGSHACGAQYVPVQMAPRKKFLYAIFRVMIKPLRHLL